MQCDPIAASQKDRILDGLPFVEALARRLASSMPHSIDIGDLVQDGIIGLIDAADRFDERRGIKFETFAERRVRGAMIDALRRDAWPRGVRRVRRELEEAREALRREMGCEPSLADLAARVGSDETRLGRTIVRINTIESTSPLVSPDVLKEAVLPPVLVPSEPEAPDKVYQTLETRERVRKAIAALPPRERRVVGLYYYGEVTMKQIAAEIGVNESRVSQLHARAIQRLRRALGSTWEVVARRSALLSFEQRTSGRKGKAALKNGFKAAPAPTLGSESPRGVLLSYARAGGADHAPKGSRRIARPASPAARTPGATRLANGRTVAIAR